jgi:hypothetical protein
MPKLKIPSHEIELGTPLISFSSPIAKTVIDPYCVPHVPHAPDLNLLNFFISHTTHVNVMIS